MTVAAPGVLRWGEGRAAWIWPAYVRHQAAGQVTAATGAIRWVACRHGGRRGARMRVSKQRRALRPTDQLLSRKGPRPRGAAVTGHHLHCWPCPCRAPPAGWRLWRAIREDVRLTEPARRSSRSRRVGNHLGWWPSARRCACRQHLRTVGRRERRHVGDEDRGRMSRPRPVAAMIGWHALWADAPRGHHGWNSWGLGLRRHAGLLVAAGRQGNLPHHLRCRVHAGIPMGDGVAATPAVHTSRRLRGCNGHSLATTCRTMWLRLSLTRRHPCPRGYRRRNGPGGARHRARRDRCDRLRLPRRPHPGLWAMWPHADTRAAGVGGTSRTCHWSIRGSNVTCSSNSSTNGALRIR
mmetsp:Transcript_66739/g.186047  ORF Transcript_66739/g.186047 Transcript_66739/m.186047 type:complete len:351 (+) Transcript_66739:1150-2202(+)